MDKSSTKLEQSTLSYNSEGFVLIPQFLSEKAVENLLKTVRRFHSSWCHQHQDIYESHAINSADLTGKDHLDDKGRIHLFETVASDALYDLMSATFDGAFAFMNTQLFFDPVQSNRQNYWHRDPQWHLSIEQQKASLTTDQVIHCRIALIDEPGIELIPKSHKQWDTQLELDTRLAQNGREAHHDLPNSEVVELKAGDLLIFSGNMIHRGLYGNNRMALDILFCENKPELLKWVNPDCLPEAEILGKLAHSEIFTRSQPFASRKG